MTTPEAIEAILSVKFPDAVVGVIDLTGTQDHFEVRMTWSGFKGKGLIEQHQCINQALQAQLEDGSIHALKIKTSAPS